MGAVMRATKNGLHIFGWDTRDTRTRRRATWFFGVPGASGCPGCRGLFGGLGSALVGIISRAAIPCDREPG